MATFKFRQRLPKVKKEILLFLIPVSLCCLIDLHRNLKKRKGGGYWLLGSMMLLNKPFTFVQKKKKERKNKEEIGIMEQFLPKVLTSNYSSKCRLNTFPNSAGCNLGNSDNYQMPWVSCQDR